MITGGINSNQYLSSTEIIDLETNQISAGPDLPQAMAYGSSVQYKDSFLVVGGHPGDFEFSEFIYEFDPNLSSWIIKSQLNTGRDIMTAFLVPDSVCR